MTRIISAKPKNSKATTLKSVLLQIQLQQYLPLFQRNEIDFTVFVTLNEQSLKSIGIKNDSHRKILLKYIRKLQQLLLTTAGIPIESNNNSMPLEASDDSLIKVSIDENNLSILTPITEEEEPGFPAASETSDDVNDVVTQTDNEEAEMTIENIKSQDSEPIRDELPTNETQPNSSSRTEDDDYTPTPRSRKHFSDSEDLLALRARGAAVRDSTWRLSMPVTNNELPSYYGKLPSYYDIVDRENINVQDEELPPYYCSVNKAGYVSKKNEFSSKGYRSRDRSWKRMYLYLWGTLIRVYKSEPVDINRVAPIHEYSMLNVQIGLAKDYAKRNNVIRVRISTGSQFLIQLHDHKECVEWIEKLQSSVNISTTIDEREMPMFITLPMRRRRIGMAIPSTTSSLTSMNSINYEGGIPIINNSSIPISASGLTFQQFNDMARELQQVQITEALPQQQLLW